MLNAVELSPVAIARVRVPIGESLPGEGPLEIAADVFWPETRRLRTPACVLFCLPGGGVSKNYFDLGEAGEVMSFAVAMAARGLVVVAIDHIGVGQSSRPRDGFALTSAVVSRCNAAAMEQLSRELRAGTLDRSLPALPDFISLGAGHSMGAMLLILQQVARRDFAALMLFGFGDSGLPSVLTEEERAMLDRPDRGLSELPRLARKRFQGEAYPPIARAEGISRSSLALRAVQDRVLAVAAMHSMMPGNIKEEIALVDVPVFLAVGDKDMVGPPLLLPASYKACSDVTLIVVEECGHHQFVAKAAPRLLARAADWANSVAV